jgi:hypothetical protein
MSLACVRWLLHIATLTVALPMPDDILIVPTVLPSGSLHFASIQQHGTVADVINALSASMKSSLTYSVTCTLAVGPFS